MERKTCTPLAAGGGGGCFLAFFFCHETIDGEQVEDDPDRTDEFVNTK